MMSYAVYALVGYRAIGKPLCVNTFKSEKKRNMKHKYPKKTPYTQPKSVHCVKRPTNEPR